MKEYFLSDTHCGGIGCWVGEIIGGLGVLIDIKFLETNSHSFSLTGIVEFPWADSLAVYIWIKGKARHIIFTLAFTMLHR